MDKIPNISVSPHIHTKDSVEKIMWSVVLALLPAGLWGAYAFGLHSFYVILTSVLSAVVTEAVIQKLKGGKVTVYDGSAVVTGILLAYNLPPSVPLWIPAVGAFFAVSIVKQAFGGLGFNIFNPALAGRAFLMAAWPKHMTTWSNPKWWPDAVSSATPLAIRKNLGEFAERSIHNYTYTDLFIGNRAGCIGEICIIVLLAGALFLFYRKIISWHVPVSFIATTGILSWVFMGEGIFRGDFLYYILSGGLILSAFFMATDMVTTPLTHRGLLIFGVGCGLITFMIRKWGGYPEGVSYSILIMNAASPVIDRHTRPMVFGTGLKKSRAGKT